MTEAQEPWPGAAGTRARARTRQCPSTDWSAAASAPPEPLRGLAWLVRAAREQSTATLPETLWGPLLEKNVPSGSATSLYQIRAAEGHFWLVHGGSAQPATATGAQSPRLRWMASGPDGQSPVTREVDRCPVTAEAALDQLVELGLVSEASARLAINAGLPVADYYRDRPLDEMPLNLRIRQRALYRQFRPASLRRTRDEIPCVPTTSVRIEIAPDLLARLPGKDRQGTLARLLGALEPIDEVDLLACRIPPGLGIHAGPPPGWTESDLRHAIAELAAPGQSETLLTDAGVSVPAATLEDLTSPDGSAAAAGQGRAAPPSSENRRAQLRQPVALVNEGYLVTATAQGVHAVIRVVVEGRIDPLRGSLHLRWMRGGIARRGTPATSRQYMRHAAGIVAGLRVSQLIHQVWRLIDTGLHPSRQLAAIDGPWGARISVAAAPAGWNQEWGPLNGDARVAGVAGLISTVGNCLDDWARLRPGYYRGCVGPIQLRLRLGKVGGP